MASNEVPTVAQRMEGMGPAKGTGITKSSIRNNLLGRPQGPRTQNNTFTGIGYNNGQQVQYRNGKALPINGASGNYTGYDQNGTYYQNGMESSNKPAPFKPAGTLVKSNAPVNSNSNYAPVNKPSEIPPNTPPRPFLPGEIYQTSASYKPTTNNPQNNNYQQIYVAPPESVGAKMNADGFTYNDPKTGRLIYTRPPVWNPETDGQEGLVKRHRANGGEFAMGLDGTMIPVLGSYPGAKK